MPSGLFVGRFIPRSVSSSASHSAVKSARNLGSFERYVITVQRRRAARASLASKVSNSLCQIAKPCFGLPRRISMTPAIFAASTWISLLRPKGLRRRTRSIAANVESYSPSLRYPSLRRSDALFAASTFPATRPAASATVAQIIRSSGLWCAAYRQFA